MTNSYNLFPKQRPSLIIIHGMNNNDQAMKPFMDYFEAQGFRTHFLLLPGHAQDRGEARDFKTAFMAFDKMMEGLVRGPYVALAFSHGALYLELWLEKHPSKRPLAQVLLAPAFYIHHQARVERIFSLLPSFMFIKSLAPKKFRRFEFLRVWEYDILLQGIKTFQKHRPSLKVPTLILIDPRDELVSAPLLMENIQKDQNPLVHFELWKREYLKKGLGQHHILFHPDYFTREDWGLFTEKMTIFFKEALGDNHG